ncbi:hypothetical protein DB44_HA00010, partial [Candidatus Protochlamydia amoebophila]
MRPTISVPSADGLLRRCELKVLAFQHWIMVSPASTSRDGNVLSVLDWAGPHLQAFAAPSATSFSFTSAASASFILLASLPQGGSALGLLLLRRQPQAELFRVPNKVRHLAEICGNLKEIRTPTS